VHDADNYGTDSYVSSHLVCLMAAVHVIVTYHMVVKHGTTLNITSLHISCALLITIVRHWPPTGAHTSPS
jgi:hypothetical protein